MNEQTINYFILFNFYTLSYISSFFFFFVLEGKGQSDANTLKKIVFWHFPLILLQIYEIQIVWNQEKTADLNFFQ